MRNAFRIANGGLLLGIALCCRGPVSGAEGKPGWQLVLRPPQPGAVFDPAQKAGVTAVVRNLGGTGPAGALEFDIHDYDGRRLGGGTVPVAVPRDQSQSVDLALGSPDTLPAGEYLSVRVRAVCEGRLQAECRKGFGLLPRREPAEPPERTPFGLLAEHQWPLAQRLGARYVRPNWNWAERPMEWAARYKIAYCPMVNEANAFLRFELSQDEYADFVRESVRRYKRYVRYWQLGNEFDIFHREGPKGYVEAQRIGYAAAKAEDPLCTVVGGSITDLHVRREGFAEALELGLAKYCDIYDFHFYADLATTDDVLRYIHSTCRRFRAEKPIWCTETTQVDTFDPDDRNQAEYVFKRYAHLLSGGVSAVFWHALAWPYPFAADKIAATALVDYEGFARPSLFAYAALTRDMAGARFVRRRPAGRGGYVLEFARGPRTLLVAWSEGGPQSVSVARGRGDCFVTSPGGRRAKRALPEGRIELRLQKSPAIYDLPRAAE
jgi:hypothetical protein